ncbi:unnamed protein product, partial [Adineta steineri]
MPFLWVENPPSLDTVEGRTTILDFVDKFLSTDLPDRNSQPQRYKLVRKNQYHMHTFTCYTKEKKELKNEQKNPIDVKTDQTSSINRSQEDDSYEKVDANIDPDLIDTRVEKREFFERAKCRFGKPEPLAAKTHFRTHKEARILTRGDRDIIIKRTTEESRRIVPYNINLLETFKEAHMEKDLVQQLACCSASTLEEARRVLLKAGNAVLSHRQIGKVEAAWLILGIPLYRCSMATVHLYISLPCHEDRLLKNINIDVNSVGEHDFIQTIIHRYSNRPCTPEIINDLSLFEFAIWFSTDYTSSNYEESENNTLTFNPLWKTNYNEPPLLRTSTHFPRIILTSGQTMRQHRNA